MQASSRELGIAERVHWLGWREDGADLIAAFDVLLLPSLWEGFGLVLLEAMSRRVPVIASRVSAIPEVVVDGETGILVDARDAPGLADAMSRLLDDRALRQHMGLLGAARLEARFSIERMVAGTLEVYRKATALIAGDGRTGRLLNVITVLESQQAGLPATTLPAGTSRVTTLPAAMTAPAPTDTPFRISACMPMKTSSAMEIGAVLAASGSMRRRCGSSG